MRNENTDKPENRDLKIFIGLLLTVVVTLLTLVVVHYIKQGTPAEPEEIQLAESASVESTTVYFDGEPTIRTWDLETGIVCYKIPHTARYGCAHTPNLPYPLRDPNQ